MFCVKKNIISQVHKNKLPVFLHRDIGTNSIRGHSRVGLCMSPFQRLGATCLGEEACLQSGDDGWRDVCTGRVSFLFFKLLSRFKSSFYSSFWCGRSCLPSDTLYDTDCPSTAIIAPMRN